MSRSPASQEVGRNQQQGDSAVIAVLASGGLDSCVLIYDLLQKGRTVQPIHVATDLTWQADETKGLRNFLRGIARPKLKGLVSLKLPVADLYKDHWSVTGRNVPGPETEDAAVFLPGRNLLLVVKAAIWCQMNQVPELALATLAANPFADASPEFFKSFEQTLLLSHGSPLSILRPYSSLPKRQVMELGRGAPLHLTFSCIQPIQGLHCGKCNKCAERQAAFKLVPMQDETRYAAN